MASTNELKGLMRLTDVTMTDIGKEMRQTLLLVLVERPCHEAGFLILG
jgi:hypothetical protein